MRPIITISSGILFICTVAALPKTDNHFKFVKKPLPVFKEHKKTEEFVKKLEYYAQNDHKAKPDYVEAIDFKLLPVSKDALAKDVEESIAEEFDLIDKENGEPIDSSLNTTSKFRSNRQMSLMYQGVYVPDSRFNAFVDGVMVNMVVEMRRKKMDPLYFRVYDRGVIEHVPTRTNSNRQKRAADPQTDVPETRSRRQGRQRQRGTAIGGGVVRGLSKVKRFGNAEVQVAGNTTLVRSHYIFGPLNIELVFDTDKGAKTINSTLSALAGHALAEIVSNNSSKHVEFIIDSPVDYQIDMVGGKNTDFRPIAKSAVMRLFKPEGRMERRLIQCMINASKKPVAENSKIQKHYRESRKLKYARRKRKNDASKEKKINKNDDVVGDSIALEGKNDMIDMVGPPSFINDEGVGAEPLGIRY